MKNVFITGSARGLGLEMARLLRKYNLKIQKNAKIECHTNRKSA